MDQELKDILLSMQSEIRSIHTEMSEMKQTQQQQGQEKEEKQRIGNVPEDELDTVNAEILCDLGFSSRPFFAR